MQTRSFHILCFLLLLGASATRAETVALALSGGGARGFAHIGILQALEEEQIDPDLIVGCSMGAVIGGLYAAGYSAAELKQIALSTDWSSLFLDKPSRRNLFLAQKETTSRHIFALRFRGLAPEVPLALTNGQKLSDLLFDLVQRAPYRPWPSFDDLRIRFRAVATDLNSGKPVVFSQGDLSEAMRASISMPLVFAPYRLDTLALVDGGVVENIPVNIAKKQGADFVIAVDLSAVFRRGDEVSAPWELADRVTTLMHIERNEESRREADLVITPDIGAHRSAEFTGVDSLIQAGYAAMKAAMPELKRKLGARAARAETVPFCDRAGYSDFLASLEPGALPPDDYRFDGVTLVPDSELTHLPKGKDGMGRLALLRRAYVDEGYTLAHATHLQMDGNRTLQSRWEEGRIRSISVNGLRRHKPGTVRREFPLRPGQIFEVRKAKRGIAQIYGSDLFESVNLAVQPSDSGADLTLRVVERASPQLRFGAGFSLERKGRSFAEFLDDNIFGIGARFSLFGKYGEKDEEARVRLTFDRFSYYSALDQALASYPMIDVTGGWNREEYLFYNNRHRAETPYFFERAGGSIWSGRAFRRWGMISPGVLYESILSSQNLREPRAMLVGAGVRTIIDTKDSYPFPTRGIEVRGQYEYQWREKSDGGAFNRITGKVDGYIPAARRFVLRGHADYGWNDRQLPLWGHYRLGGEESLLGLHIAERSGNVLLSGLAEARFDLISRWLADAYVSAIFTVGAVSGFSDPLPRAQDYQQGVGLSFALSTFLGPMKFTAGELLRSEISKERLVLYLNLGHEF